MFFNKLQQFIVADYAKINPKHKYHYGKAENESIVIIVDGYSCYRIPKNDFALSFEWVLRVSNNLPLTQVDKIIPEHVPYDYERIYFRCIVSDSTVKELSVYENEKGSMKIFLNHKLYKDYLKEFEKGYDLTFWAKDDRSIIYVCFYDTVIAGILPVRR